MPDCGHVIFPADWPLRVVSGPGWALDARAPPWLPYSGAV